MKSFRKKNYIILFFSFISILRCANNTNLEALESSESETRIIKQKEIALLYQKEVGDLGDGGVEFNDLIRASSVSVQLETRFQHPTDPKKDQYFSIVAQESEKGPIVFMIKGGKLSINEIPLAVWKARSEGFFQIGNSLDGKIEDNPLVLDSEWWFLKTNQNGKRTFSAARGISYYQGGKRRELWIMIKTLIDFSNGKYEALPDIEERNPRQAPVPPF